MPLLLTTTLNQIKEVKNEKKPLGTKMDSIKEEKKYLNNKDESDLDCNCVYLTHQTDLEKHAKILFKRIKGLQAKQVDMHLNKQLKSFVKYEQLRNHINCQYISETRKTEEKRYNNNLNNSNFINNTVNSYIIKTPTAEEQIKLLSPDDVKNLSTAALVNLVKSLNSAVDQHQSLAISNSASSSSTLSLQNQLLHQNQHLKLVVKEEKSLKSNNLNDKDDNLPAELKENSDEVKKEMLTSCGILRNNLKHIECTYDSDATESSSGGESCDEENDIGKQGHSSSSIISIPIDKRAFWKWSVERAAIASTWTWLQAQVADLEFKIRQQNEMYRTLRATKGTITFSATNINSSISSTPPETPSALSSPKTPTSLNQNESNEEDIPNCVRTLPLKQMRKRKLVRSMNALAGATRKIARYSTVQCKCNSLPHFVSPCVLCNGRYGYVQVIDTDCMPYYERVALLDSSCHPVLSLPNDVSLGLHFSKILKKEKSQQIASRQQYKKKEANSLESQYQINVDGRKGKKAQIVLPTSKSKKRLDNQVKKKGSKGLSEESTSGKRSKVKDENANGSGDSKYDSPVASPFCTDVNASAPLSRRRRSEQHAYDINNIVIPYSIASTTRVEKLEYKEIITPKWRMTDDNQCELVNISETAGGETTPIISKEIKNEKISTTDTVQNNCDNSDKNIPCLKSKTDILCVPIVNEEEEDLSDDVFAIRHQKCELDERKRFGSILNKTKNNSKGPGRGRWSRTRLDSNRSDTNANVSVNNGPSGDSVNNIDTSSQDSFASTPEGKSKDVKDNNSNTFEIVHGTPAKTIERHRTSSSSKREDSIDEEHYIEVTPFEKRTFPLPDDIYEEILKLSRIEEEEIEKEEQKRRQHQQQEQSETLKQSTSLTTDVATKIVDMKQVDKSPDNSTEISTPASPILSDASSSIADNEADTDDVSADPEWEPKKV